MRHWTNGELRPWSDRLIAIVDDYECCGLANPGRLVRVMEALALERMSNAATESAIRRGHRYLAEIGYNLEGSDGTKKS